jgi:hypothetical protein
MSPPNFISATTTCSRPYFRYPTGIDSAVFEGRSVRGSQPRADAVTTPPGITLPVGVELHDPNGDPEVHNDPVPDDSAGLHDNKPGPPDAADDLIDNAVGPFGKRLDAPAPVDLINTRRSGRNRTLAQR